MRFAALLLVATWLLSSASPASAIAVYSYTGNPYEQIVDGPPPGTYTSDMRVTGSITLAAPLPPNLPLTAAGGTR